jgi:hypothetical protein
LIYYFRCRRMHQFALHRRHMRQRAGILSVPLRTGIHVGEKRLHRYSIIDYYFLCVSDLGWRSLEINRFRNELKTVTRF